jgi:hypothetical protein
MGSRTQSFRRSLTPPGIGSRTLEPSTSVIFGKRGNPNTPNIFAIALIYFQRKIVHDDLFSRRHPVRMGGQTLLNGMQRINTRRILIADHWIYKSEIYP